VPPPHLRDLDDCWHWLYELLDGCGCEVIPDITVYGYEKPEGTLRSLQVERIMLIHPYRDEYLKVECTITADIEYATYSYGCRTRDEQLKWRLDKQRVPRAVRSYLGAHGGEPVPHAHFPPDGDVHHKYREVELDEVIMWFMLGHDPRNPSPVVAIS
jgi:hypothetical protein